MYAPIRRTSYERFHFRLRRFRAERVGKRLRAAAERDRAPHIWAFGPCSRDRILPGREIAAAVNVALCPNPNLGRRRSAGKAFRPSRPPDASSALRTPGRCGLWFREKRPGCAARVKRVSPGRVITVTVWGVPSRSGPGVGGRTERDPLCGAWIPCVAGGWHGACTTKG